MRIHSAKIQTGPDKHTNVHLCLLILLCNKTVQKTMIFYNFKYFYSKNLDIRVLLQVSDLFCEKEKA